MALPYLYDVGPRSPDVTLWHSGRWEAASRGIARKLMKGLAKRIGELDVDLLTDFVPHLRSCTEIVTLTASSEKMGWGSSWVRIWVEDAPAFEAEAHRLLPGFLEEAENGSVGTWQQGRGGRYALEWGTNVTCWR